MHNDNIEKKLTINKKDYDSILSNNRIAHNYEAVIQKGRSYAEEVARLALSLDHSSRILMNSGKSEVVNLLVTADKYKLPMSYKEAMNTNEATKWKEACQSELDLLKTIRFIVKCLEIKFQNCQKFS